MVKLTKVKGHQREHICLEKKTTRRLRKESTLNKIKETIDTGYSLLHSGGAYLDIFT